MENDKQIGSMLRSGFELQQGPVSNLDEYQTSLPHLFYVTHMGIANVLPETWRLTIDGLVQTPLQLSWADLASYPRERIIATHECAGSPLQPTVPVRRVGNVEWEGVPLRCLLEQVGVLPEARFMWSTGADSGVFNGVFSSCYQKDLPVSVAQQGRVLLATHLNGQPLSPERGAPLRMVVPDYYGTNSTKWLVGLSFQERRSPNYYASHFYNDQVQGVRQPVWALAPHALMVSHSEGQLLHAGEHLVWGWAWASGGVAMVEVSIDGGQSWLPTTLSLRVDFGWQRFSVAVNLQVGAQHWLCRATANDGRAQPPSGARNEWFGLRLQVIE
jgi:DMSO/TMAO reductase YedYZ molybdopterin-dependent catalytic subunit